MFITLEGGEGAGKSTQCQLLKKYLENLGKKVILTREPGGSIGAENIRDLLVKGSVDRWSTTTEILLMYAARADHFEKIIKPALENNIWVICDRFADSTVAYQGYGKGYDLEFLEVLYKQVIGERQPDLTFIFDLDIQLGLGRADKRMNQLSDAENRFENMNLEFHEKVRDGFLKILKDNPNRCRLIDAAVDINSVHDQIVEYTQLILKD